MSQTVRRDMCHIVSGFTLTGRFGPGYTPTSMIYLDYAATAPLRPEVAERIRELTQQPLGNPSSLHRAGRKARMVLEHARERCARALGVKVEEILFCSGATEADNLAILGALTHFDSRWEHIVSSRVEHAAVFETVKRQEQLGRGVSWLSRGPRGTRLPRRTGAPTGAASRQFGFRHGGE